MTGIGNYTKEGAFVQELCPPGTYQPVSEGGHYHDYIDYIAEIAKFNIIYIQCLRIGYTWS